MFYFLNIIYRLTQSWLKCLIQLLLVDSWKGKKFYATYIAHMTETQHGLNIDRF